MDKQSSNPMDMPEISKEMYKVFVEFIYTKSGISLGDKKEELVKARLMKRMRFHKFRSFRRYYDYVLKDKSGEEITQMLNAISTNVTYFFREDGHFDYLSKTVLPEIINKKNSLGDKKIRIWSAGCSTGEEVYSILVTLNEYIKDLSNWDIKILGTDLSTKTLEVATLGVYSWERRKDIPIQFFNKYFIREWKGTDKKFRIKQEAKKYVVFRRLNLMRESYPFSNKFDIIFCRNVMIYFDKKVQGVLVNKFYKYLVEQGYLFVGHSESLIGIKTGFKKVSTAVHKK